MSDLHLPIKHHGDFPCIYNMYNMCIYYMYNMYMYIYMCICMCMYMYMSSGRKYLLLTMDMAKVGGPPSVVKVCTSMLCVRIGYQ